MGVNIRNIEIIDVLNKVAFEIHEAGATGILSDALINKIQIYAPYSLVLSEIYSKYPITTMLGDVITMNTSTSDILSSMRRSNILINNKMMVYESL